MDTVPTTPGSRFELTFAQDDRNAPQQARRAVAALKGIDERLRRDLTVVVSELVANAVRHAPRVAGGRIVLAPGATQTCSGSRSPTLATGSIRAPIPAGTEGSA